MDKYIEKILTARVYEVSDETPLEHAAKLSMRYQREMLFKREDKQPVFSFKCRGAYNKLHHLLKEQPETTGVVACSAGNHAQGVALSASRLGIESTIVMPETTPMIKVEAVKGFGGKVVLKGDAYDDAYAHAMELSAAHDWPLIHPFDDPFTIAGQGTVGVEIGRQHPDAIDAVFIPVGGGGLAAGVAAYLKFLRPEVKIIGVESDDAASMKASLEQGKPVDIGPVGLFADGTAVKIPGKHCFALVQQYVDEIMTVSVDEMCAAIKDVFEDTRTLLEPSGVLSVAAMKVYAKRENQPTREGALISILSGANINFDRLRHVAERAEIGERREALFSVTIPEKPGAFKAFCSVLGARAVTEFNYRYARAEAAQVFVGVKLTGGLEESQMIASQLREAGYTVDDLTDNEMAKLHVRYMVGGRAANVPNERVFRFVFPERPGALLNFLNKMISDWNISLFHYRNHGSAFGRVLCAMQVPEHEMAQFADFLAATGYEYNDEAGNPAYQAFLR